MFSTPNNSGPTTTKPRISEINKLKNGVIIKSKTYVKNIPVLQTSIP